MSLPRRKPGGRPARISREQVLGIARTIPAGKLTFSAIAARVGVNPEALYYHFPSRDALLAEVCEQTLSGFDLKPADPADWRGWLESTFAALYRFMLENPLVLEIEHYSRLGRVAAPILEAVLETLEGAGFGPQEAHMMWTTTFTLAYSQARGLNEFRAIGDRARQKRIADEARAALGDRFPRVLASSAAVAGKDPREIFAETLHWLVAALPAPAQPRAASRRRKPAK